MLESLKNVTDEVPGIPPSPLPEHNQDGRTRVTESVLVWMRKMPAPSGASAKPILGTY